MSPALILLAAGKGSRMNSDRPKPLHEIGGLPLVLHALRAALTLEPARVVVVTEDRDGPVAAAVRGDWPEAEVAVQAERRGTAHAVLAARAALAGFGGDALVLYADTPFLAPETLAAVVAARAMHDVVVLGFEAADPARYGRLVMDGDTLGRIVEWRDASEALRAIRLCNSGILCADAATLLDLCEATTDTNAAGEFYLTEVVALARARGLTTGVVICPEAETLGIDTRAALAAAGAAFQARARAAALEDGVTLADPGSVIFAADTVIGRDAVIGPYVVFGPGVTVESGAEIRAFSHLEGCHVSRGAIVGPFARLRPGAELAEDVRVGNFVEIKASVLEEGAKVNHLSYVGDATVGARANLGAGTVTCNYDGVGKHRTEIGAGAFVGSNTMLVAPVTVGRGAMTASGSVITEDVPEDALGVGRARQVVKPGFAARFFAALRSEKAAR